MSTQKRPAGPAFLMRLKISYLLNFIISEILTPENVFRNNGLTPLRVYNLHKKPY
jgi:hypothetical protein